MNLPLNIGDAYTVRAEKRWWIVTWTPAGMLVRLLLSYPDKPSALHAISMLGYREVPQPKPGEGDTVLAAFHKWFSLPKEGRE